MPHLRCAGNGTGTRSEAAPRCGRSRQLLVKSSAGEGCMPGLPCCHFVRCRAAACYSNGAARHSKQVLDQQGTAGHAGLCHAKHADVGAICGHRVCTAAVVMHVVGLPNRYSVVRYCYSCELHVAAVRSLRVMYAPATCEPQDTCSVNLPVPRHTLTAMYVCIYIYIFTYMLHTYIYIYIYIMMIAPCMHENWYLSGTCEAALLCHLMHVYTTRA